MCFRILVQDLDGRSVSDTSQSYYGQTNKCRDMLVYSRTVRACFQHAACLAAPESEAVASAVPVAELLNNLGEQTIAWKPQQSTATAQKHGVQGFGGCLNATLLVPASPGWGLIVGGCGCSEPSGIDRLADTSCRTDQVTESRVHTARLSLRLRVCCYCVARGAWPTLSRLGCCCTVQTGRGLSAQLGS